MIVGDDAGDKDKIKILTVAPDIYRKDKEVELNHCAER